MKCPFCGAIEDRVVDSRTTKDNSIIRRRRECESCEKRFTTYERIEETLPLIIKKDNRREPFDRQKIISGLQKACEKRPISIREIETLVDEIEHQFQESGEKEIPASSVGEMVMKRLQKLDEVAYVRFASVYRSFRDVNEFMSELQDLVGQRHTPRKPALNGPSK